MELFERYVRILRLFLPKNQRDDIIRELSEEFESQVARKQEDLGRSLTSDEYAAIISQYGHPLLLAARYRPQEYLVGPVIFPFYWLALKVTLALVVAGHLVAGLVLLAGDPTLPLIGQAVEELVGTLLKIAGWFAVLAVLMERWIGKTRMLEKWSPGVVPEPVQHAMSAVEHAQQVARHAVSHAVGRHGSATHRGYGLQAAQPPSIARFVVAVVLSVWWLLALKFPTLIFGNGADVLDWAPIVDRVYPVLVLVQIVMLAAHFVTLTGSHDARLWRVSRYVGVAGGLLFLYFVFTVSHEWVVWTGPADARARFQVAAHIAGRDLSLVDLINYSISFALIVAAFVSVASMLARFGATARKVAGLKSRATY